MPCSSRRLFRMGETTNQPRGSRVYSPTTFRPLPSLHHLLSGNGSFLFHKTRRGTHSPRVRFISLVQMSSSFSPVTETAMEGTTTHRRTSMLFSCIFHPRYLIQAQRQADLISILSATNIAGSKFDSSKNPIADDGDLDKSITPATYVSFVNFIDNTQLARFGLHNGIFPKFSNHPCP